MYEPYVPITQFVDVSLPMLPGQVGPSSSTAVLRIDADVVSTETVTLDRLELPAPPAEVEPIEDMRTVIVERPDRPYADWTKARLYKRAQELGVPGRSKLNKQQLRETLIAFEGR